MRRPLLGLLLVAVLLVGCGGGGGSTSSSSSNNNGSGSGGAGGTGNGGTSYSILYASNYTARTADTYRLNTSSASLTPFAGSPFDTVPPPGLAHSLVADPLGRFVYVIDSGETQYVVPPVEPSIRTFRVNRHTGVLTETGRLTASTVGFIFPHPNGRIVYEIIEGNFAKQPGSINSYEVDQANGTLTKVSTVSMDVPYTIASWAALDPSGRYLFTIGPRTLDPYDQGTTVVTYAINGATLARVATFDATPYAGSGPGPFTVSRDFAFMSEGVLGIFRVARINGDGSLSLVFASSSIPGQLETDGMVVSPDGKMVYLHNPLHNTMESWSVDTAGTLHLVSSNPAGFFVTDPQLMLSKDGRMLMMMNWYRTVYSYAIDASGKISLNPVDQYATSDRQQWTNLALVE